jgi:hypothetical protein
MTNRENLIQKIQTLGFPDNEIIVTIEDFFEGNDDFGSIGCNIYPDQPSLSDFYKRFKGIKQNESVDNIYIRIADIDDGIWPFTDTVYVISNLKIDQIKELLVDLRPDEVYEDWMYGKPINAPELRPDMKVYSIFWD